MHLQNRVTPICEIVSAAGPTRRRHHADNALIVARVKASAADIKAGDYVATGGVPQTDGTQKAGELRIFPESVRGIGRVAGRRQRHDDQQRGRPDRLQRRRPRPRREIPGRREEDHRRAEPYRSYA
jgi:hypothetical protein